MFWDAQTADPGGGERSVALGIVAQRAERRVACVLVDLDDETVPGPVEVDLEPAGPPAARVAEESALDLRPA